MYKTVKSPPHRYLSMRKRDGFLAVTISLLKVSLAVDDGVAWRYPSDIAVHNNYYFQ